jgi:hypothetical protein
MLVSPKATQWYKFALFSKLVALFSGIHTKHIPLMPMSMCQFSENRTMKTTINFKAQKEFYPLFYIFRPVWIKFGRRCPQTFFDTGN